MNPELNIGEEVFKKSIPELSESELKKERKETYFKAVLIKELRDVFKESMEECEIDENTVSEFFRELSGLPEDEILAVMAIPVELRNRVFSSFKERSDAGKIDVAGFLSQLRKRAAEGGYRMGFHTSNQDIKMIETLEKGESVIKWDVSATEKDHRDSDLLRAYYSLDYMNLYRKKSAKYLYMIRAETGQNSSHRQDNDGSWGRASALPIVARLDLTEVDRQIEEALKNDSEKQN